MVRDQAMPEQALDPASLHGQALAQSTALFVSSCHVTSKGMACCIWISYSEPYHPRSGDVSWTLVVGISGSATVVFLLNVLQLVRLFSLHTYWKDFKKIDLLDI